MQEGDQSCTTITGGCDPSASLGEVFFSEHIERHLFVFQPQPQIKW